MTDEAAATHIGLLRFEPIFRSVRWGGTRLAAFKGLESLPVEQAGESWELSGLPGEETVVSEGRFAGLTLSEILKSYGQQILGARLFAQFGEFFPLLIKFIDADDDLSIQVHPDRERATSGLGKTELWYIIKSEPGSYIYSGFNRPLTPDNLRKIMTRNRLVEVLAKHFAKEGDVFYVPAGRIHSIGAGNLLLEIQQTSSETYRLHDYNRLDADGKLRELHIDKAFDLIDYDQTDFELAHPQLLIGCETRVKKTPYFIVTAAQIMENMRIPVAAYDSPRILIAIAGAGTVKDNYGNCVQLRCGQTILVPAETEFVEVTATATPLKLITVYIP